MRLCGFILFCCLSALPASVLARQAGASKIPVKSDREFIMTQYEYAYNGNPAMLSWWDYATYSWVGAGFDFENGKFHHLQTYDRLMKGRVETESILRQKKRKWTFHGKFIYENGSVDSLRANLSYNLRDNGSPSFYFCRKPGTRWDIQKYGLEATASRRIGDRWSVGGQFLYTGDLAFRKNDVRNSQTTLTIQLAISGSYRIGDHHIISAGADFLRVKEKPSFSRIYETGADYTILLMNGLGTYIRNLQSDVSWQEITPGGFVQWMQAGDRNRFSISYYFSAGNDRWRNDAYQAEEMQAEWTKYGFMKHKVLFSEIVYLGGSLLNIRGGGKYISGRGESWNRNSSVYIQNYDYSGMEADLDVEWRPGRSVVRKVAASGNWMSDKKRDKSYDYLFVNSSIEGGANVELGFKAGSTMLSANIGGMYHHSLGVNHQPNAATESNNEYTRYIGVPLARWLSADYVRAGITLNVDVPVGKKNLLGTGVTFDYTLPVVNIPVEYGKTHFMGAKVFISVYF